MRVIVELRFHNPISPWRAKLSADLQKGPLVLSEHRVRLGDDEVRAYRERSYTRDPERVGSVDLRPLDDPSPVDRFPQLLTRLTPACRCPQDHENHAPSPRAVPFVLLERSYEGPFVFMSVRRSAREANVKIGVARITLYNLLQ
ncbi:hypothetical protein SEA_SUCCESS_37 [Streptomyces phage Success]|uniref:Uncharacterized protein n=1 Tax=Streptomyces phage Success TaxID=2999013 RepID=A0A9E8S3S2_9CAUD|nr:hypothetical protein QEH47_gp37 [Streptomyces phage Success]WAB08824.1 hypothetical protein SEA_SUCCESS_37 [Streptomyces phage Success]